MKVLLYRTKQKEKMIGHKNQIHVGDFVIIDVPKDEQEFCKILNISEINVKEIEILEKDFYLIFGPQENDNIVSVYDKENDMVVRGDVIIAGSYGDVMTDLISDGINRIRNSLMVGQFKYNVDKEEKVLLYNQHIYANLNPINEKDGE